VSDPGAPVPLPEALEHCTRTFMYSREAFLVDEMLRVDPQAGEIEAIMETVRPLPVSRFQVGDPRVHPRHVAAADLILLTTSLGAAHAYFLHGCRWDEGWVGFGNRIHRADFRRLATIGSPLRLHSKEIRLRRGPKRLVIRYEFHFWQGDALVYFGDHSAMFVKDRVLDASGGEP
jgi:hypothetical protein